MKVPELSSILTPANDGSSFVGAEHEYRVLERGVAIDFRTVIHELGLGQPRLDPGDANAYRLPSGAKLTCDVREAEIALPPTAVRPGFARRMARAAAAERSDLLRRLTDDFRLEGHSTHISVAVPASLVDPVARLYTERFATAQILLTDRSPAPGIAIRPRPGRIEVCGEFIEGHTLARAGLFAAAAIRECLQWCAGPGTAARLPPALKLVLRPVVDRLGWYVDGVDPELVGRSGRAARLGRRDGGDVAVGDYLASAWCSAREAILPLVGTNDLGPIDAVVAGGLPVPLGGPDAEWIDMSESRDDTTSNDVLSTRQRPGFTLAPLMLTWDVNIFMVAGGASAKRVFLCVPAAWLNCFITSLDSGRLDDVLMLYLEGRIPAARLRRRGQIKGPAVYRSLCPRVKLLPRERTADSRAARKLLDGGPKSTRPRWLWERVWA